MRVVTLLLIFISANGFSQTTHIPLKEEFDKYNVFETPSWVYDHFPSTYVDGVDMDGNLYGDALCKTIEGYIDMYFTTGDKAYLYKFVHESMCIMKNRHDINPNADLAYNTEPRWSIGLQLYQDGQITAAFSRFVYLVKSEVPELYYTPLYSFDELDPSQYVAYTPYCNFTGQTFATFGEYAEWLQNRASETLQWFVDNGYWVDAYGMRQSLDHNYALNINQSSGFARAFLFNGITATNADFTTKAQFMEDQMVSFLNIDDDCEDQTYNHNLLRISGTTSNAYWWFQPGWRIQQHSCFGVNGDTDDLLAYTEFVEDISHAVMVTWFARDFYFFNPNSNLTDDHMIRFRNMFTKYIYNQNTGLFWVGVNGNNDFIESNILEDLLGAPGFVNSLNYVWFYQFDGADGTSGPPNAYDISFNYYENDLTGLVQTPVHFGGQHHKGQAEMIRAQWDVECPNLSLYNRKVVYDQDFFSKCHLRVVPEEHNSASFAFPVITEQMFEVEPNVEVEMSAHTSITLSKGVHIKPNSDFHAFIDESICSGGNKSPEGSSNLSQTNLKEPTSIFENDPKFNIYPNPFNDEVNVSLPSSYLSGSWKIVNADGKVILKGFYSESFFKLNTNYVESGVYILSVNDNVEGQKQIKIIK